MAYARQDYSKGVSRIRIESYMRFSSSNCYILLMLQMITVATMPTSIPVQSPKKGIELSLG